ncbi:uncharacterized protein MONBRDRAFT_15842 [Monosiga brevicollis MX1]|uniref:SET domain-containing protein n=1 Tax=Monosiga brevicollis TaxID=81824 RepID=A9UV45_MONBE|nr:uncharacterized protein MONBRDRAFT_15842 [Monosiga brevicollis MX1]EDQ90832.1 predicted protein [Monosiga brevicollis MX1]|eukprot:XP_001744129.1 hypothetical protein [Monosiga brevicollis MX1]
MDAKGKGVLAGRAFRRGEYVCEYAGELIELEEAHRREERYRTEATAKGLDEMMCYMYFLRHKSRTYCVDATQTGRVGRLINHSRAKPNLKTKLFVLDDRPHLGFIVKRDIEKGEELLYDYGERDPATLRQMPWLKQ